MTNYQRPMTRPYLPVIWIIFAHRWTVFDNRHCSKPNRFSLSLQELIASSFISCIIYIWSDCKRNVSQLHPFTLVTEGYMGWVRSLVSVIRWIPIAIDIGSSPAVMLSRLDPSLSPSLQPLLLPKLSRLANRPLSLSPALQYCNIYFIQRQKVGALNHQFPPPQPLIVDFVTLGCWATDSPFQLQSSQNI